MEISIVIIVIIAVLFILFIRVCVLEYRHQRYKALPRRKTPQKHVVIQKCEASTDWWDQPADDSGWTNGDYICASEIFDEW